MPLFVIAIAVGAATLGAATVDLTSDGQFGGANQHTAQVQAVPQPVQTAQVPVFNPNAYPTQADCLNAAAARGIAASACQR